MALVPQHFGVVLIGDDEEDVGLLYHLTVSSAWMAMVPAVPRRATEILRCAPPPGSGSSSTRISQSSGQRSRTVPDLPVISAQVPSTRTSSPVCQENSTPVPRVSS